MRSPPRRPIKNAGRRRSCPSDARPSQGPRHKGAAIRGHLSMACSPAISWPVLERDASAGHARVSAPSANPGTFGPHDVGPGIEAQCPRPLLFTSTAEVPALRVRGPLHCQGRAFSARPAMPQLRTLRTPSVLVHAAPAKDTWRWLRLSAGNNWGPSWRHTREMGQCKLHGHAALPCTPVCAR